MDLSWLLAFFALVVIYIISHELNEIVTPATYMFGTYMYILLGIIIVGCSWKVGDEVGMEGMMHTKEIMGLFLVSVVALFGTMLSSSNTVRHVAWTVFMVSMGLISYVCYKYAQMGGTLPTIFLSMVMLVLLLSWMAYTQPLGIFDSWFEPMMGMLLGLIIVQIIDYMVFFSNSTIDQFATRSRIYSWITLVLFSGFLLYDTQKLKMNAILISKLCQGRTQMECTNYPAASLSIFLDMMNLFTSMSNLSGGR